MKEYILGVDGGNTKTDYFLFDSKGVFVDHYRGGTCSHEALPNSFDGTYEVLEKVFDVFLKRNSLLPQNIKASVFGLAGVDTPYQKKQIEEIVKKLGFNNFKVVNDSFLGIKAVSSYGVCSICGTGTSAGGIDAQGNELQVGGIGAIVGDEAGGNWLARRAIRQTFDYLYRFGRKSLINDIVLDEFGVEDKYYLMEAISDKLITSKKVDLERICKAVFECANQGDEVCLGMLKVMANNLARSAGGCVVNLDLGENPLVVLAGSVWVKGSNKTLIETFKELICFYTKKKCDIRLLTVPPATGAICWAFELLNNSFPNDDEIKRIVKIVEDKLNI